MKTEDFIETLDYCYMNLPTETESIHYERLALIKDILIVINNQFNAK